MNQLKYLKELHAKTTQGEWVVSRTINNYTQVHSKDIIKGYPIIKSLRTNGPSDIQFCVEAHKMLPLLIEALEKCMEQRNQNLICSDFSESERLKIELEDNKELEQILEGKGVER